MAIYIDATLWKKMIKIIRQTPYERAFYLIGFYNDNESYVIEIFEVLYQSSSITHIISDPYGRMLISNSLPAGIKLLGIAHSHPFDQSSKPEPSSIDLELAREYEGDIIITMNPTGEATAVKFAGDYEDVRIKIEDFPRELRIIRVDDIYFVFPWWLQDTTIKLRIPQLYGEIMYRLYFHSYFDGKRIIIPEYEWFYVKQKYSIPHIAFGNTRDLTKRYLLENSITKLLQSQS